MVSDRDRDLTDDEREVELEDEADFDGPPPTIDQAERIELDRHLARELDLDGFEQGIQG